MTAAAASPSRRGEILGHPAGLFVLFFTEMWERFCQYGMRALLALYVAHRIALPDVAPHIAGFTMLRAAIERVFGPQDNVQIADQIYGLYTAFASFTPLFGGILADRVLGQRKSVVLGGVIMVVGEFMLMRESLFCPGLLTMVVGLGCFKSNISTQVGRLYAPGDPRRDRAFNLFYMGINVGAWLSPLVCGTLGQTFGWAWGFGAAGVGMVVGLVVYLWGQKYLAADPVMMRAHAKEAPVSHCTKPAPLTHGARMRILALVVLCPLTAFFWAVDDQQGNSLQFWVDENTDLRVLSWIGLDWQMPSTWFQSLNPLFILLLTPLVNRLWMRQACKRTEPSSIVKMAIGCIFVAMGFWWMFGAVRVADAGHLANFGWLAACTLFLTFGEIYVSPVGLSLVTKIAPARMVSMLMGMWFLAIFFGDYLSGFLATYAHRLHPISFFAMLSAIALAAGTLIFAVAVPLKRVIGDENDPTPA